MRFWLISIITLIIIMIMGKIRGIILRMKVVKIFDYYLVAFGNISTDYAKWEFCGP